MSRFGPPIETDNAKYLIQGSQLGLAMAQHVAERQQYQMNFARMLQNDAFQQMTDQDRLGMEHQRLKIAQDEQALKQAMMVKREQDAEVMRGGLLNFLDQQERASMPPMPAMPSAPGMGSDIGFPQQPLPPGVAAPQQQAPAANNTLGEFRRLVQAARDPETLGQLGKLAQNVGALETKMKTAKVLYGYPGSAGLIDSVQDPYLKAIMKAHADANDFAGSLKVYGEAMEAKSKAEQQARAAAAAGVDPVKAAAMDQMGPGGRMLAEHNQKQQADADKMKAGAAAYQRLRSGESQRAGTAEQDFALAREANLVNQEAVNISGRQSMTADDRFVIEQRAKAAKEARDRAEEEYRVAAGLKKEEPLKPPTKYEIEGAEGKRTYFLTSPEKDKTKVAAWKKYQSEQASYEKSLTPPPADDEIDAAIDSLTKQLGRPPTTAEVKAAIQGTKR